MPGPMIRYEVAHHTTYWYSELMTSAQMIAHLVPRSTDHQTVVDSIIAVDPAPSHRHTQLDVFGNLRTFLSIEHPHVVAELAASSTIEVVVPDLPPDQPWREVVETLESDTTEDGLLARWCRLDSPLVERSESLHDFAAPSFPADAGLVEGLTHLTSRIFEEFTFDPLATDLSTPIEEVLRSRRGVCQDFAQVAVGCLRSIGLPARYVSGYIETESPAGQPRLVGADASHAWVATYLPGHSWVDADPTNDQVPTTRHLTVAWGRDYGDVAPVRGITFGPPAHQQLTVSVDVHRVR